MPFAAFAQSVPDYVQKAPPPNWVIPQSVPLEDTSLSPEGSQFYRLVDWQQRINQTENDRYRRYALELKTLDAVQDNSNFKISFDPSYQKILIHNLDLIRDEKRLDRLNMAAFEIYRMETERDRLLYNGTLQTSLIIPDVQVGDILDYSYTVTGKNKAFGPHYKTSTQLKYSVPVQKQHERILIHKDLPLHVLKHGKPVSPKEGEVGSYRSFQWLQNDLESIEIESNLPSWHYARPTYELSSFKSWKEVGEYFADKYEFSYLKGGPITKIANEIKKKSDNIKTRRRLALNYIHENIRYTGIEIGSGGYIPRPPEETLAQKFGDCKDMTVLLVAILQELNIEAYPVLVDGDHRNGLADMIPSYAAFDHVLVLTKAAGETYLLDGTRGRQLGDLDHMEQGSYGKGLLLKSGEADLIDLDLKNPIFYKDVQDTFDVLTDTGEVRLESISNYFGYEADAMNSTLINEGREKIEKNFIEFFQNTYPDIEQIGDMTIEAFPELGKFVVRVTYKLKNAWVTDEENGYEAFEAFPSDVSSDVPDFKGGTRNMSYVISHPRSSRHKLIFKLDETWSLEDEDLKFDNDSFNFHKISTFKNGVYTQNHIYKSKKDHISPESFSEVMSQVGKIEDELGVELTNGTDWLSNLSEEVITAGIIFWYLLATVLSLIGVITRNNVDADWRDELIYSPIKLSKFLLLSAVSMGLYTYYWVFKNWRWARDVDNHANLPLIRSWLMVFTNFALFPRFAKDTTDAKGLDWFSSTVAIFLAFVYFAMEVIGRVGNRDDSAPMWMSIIGLISFIAIIPAVMQVNKLNIGKEDLILKNSQYYWTTIAFILLFVPIFLLTLYGLTAP